MKEFEFMGHTHRIIEVDGLPWVALKDIVEGMTLDWKNYKKRHLTDDLIEGVELERFDLTRDAGDGGSGLTPHVKSVKGVWCIKVMKVWGFLLTIMPNNNMDPERKELIREYRRECAQALHDYWENGVAYNTNFRKEFTSYDDKVATAKSFLSYVSRDLERDFLKNISDLRHGTPMYQAVCYVCLALGYPLPPTDEQWLAEVFNRMTGASTETILKEMLK